MPYRDGYKARQLANGTWSITITRRTDVMFGLGGYRSVPSQEHFLLLTRRSPTSQRVGSGAHACGCSFVALLRARLGMGQSGRSGAVEG